jgi:hypothetical protein
MATSMLASPNIIILFIFMGYTFSFGCFRRWVIFFLFNVSNQVFRPAQGKWSGSAGGQVDSLAKTFYHMVAARD